MNLKKKKKGFTLIELMAVIAIIAILAAVLVPTVNGYITRSKKTAILTQVRTAVNAVESYNATASVKISDDTNVAQLVARDGAATAADGTAANGVLKDQELLIDTDVNKLADTVTVGELKQINSDKEDAMNNIKQETVSGVKKFNYTFVASTTPKVTVGTRVIEK